MTHWGEVQFSASAVEWLCGGVVSVKVGHQNPPVDRFGAQFRPQFFGSGLVVVAWRLTYSLSGGRKAGKGGKAGIFVWHRLSPFTTFFLGSSKKCRVRFFRFHLDSFLSRL